jgi:CMP-N-acetylneuraminic acid synthetase
MKNTTRYFADSPTAKANAMNTTTRRCDTIAKIAAMDPSETDRHIKAAAILFNESDSDILTSVLEYRRAAAEVTNYR